MYNFYDPYPCPYNSMPLMHSLDNMYNPYHICPCCANSQYNKQELLGHLTNRDFQYKNGMNYNSRHINPDLIKSDNMTELKDYGPKPFVTNINDVTLQNNNFRIALWTGEYLQVTLMRINVGDDIGLELHTDTDQFIRIEQGQGLVQMGDSKDELNFQRRVYDDYSILIPAGKWHNLINTGTTPLKLYSIYAPPHHPQGTIHQTKAIAQMSEENHN